MLSLVKTEAPFELQILDNGLLGISPVGRIHEHFYELTVSYIADALLSVLTQEFPNPSYSNHIFQGDFQLINLQNGTTV